MDTDLAAYRTKREHEDKLNKIANTRVCAQCGGPMVVRWNGQEMELWCHLCKGYHGYTRLDPALQRLWDDRKAVVARGGDTSIADEEIEYYVRRKYSKQKGRKGMTQEIQDKALAKYQQTGIIAKETAIEVIRSVPGWDKAPANVIELAATLCRDWRIYPGQHVYLIGFKKRRGGQVIGEDWSVVVGINADRMITRRSLNERGRDYSYVDESPRVATEAEIMRKYGKVEPNRIYALCRVRTLPLGGEVAGWGWWNCADTVYGTDKGNSVENMAMVRAERQALRMIREGCMPNNSLRNVEVIDEQYLNGNYTVDTIDTETGEILEADAPAEIEAPIEQVAHDLSELQKNRPEKPKQKKPGFLKGDPGSFNPATYREICGAAKYYYDREPNEVEDACKEIYGKVPQSKQEALECWTMLVGNWEDAKNSGATDQAELPFK